MRVQLLFMLLLRYIFYLLFSLSFRRHLYFEKRRKKNERFNWRYVFNSPALFQLRTCTFMRRMLKFMIGDAVRAYTRIEIKLGINMKWRKRREQNHGNNNFNALECLFGCCCCDDGNENEWIEKWNEKNHNQRTFFFLILFYFYI